MRGLDMSEGNSLLSELLRHARQCLWRTSQHAGGGAVDRRQAHLFGQVWQDLSDGQRDRDHCSRGLLTNQLRPLCHQRQRIVQREHAGEAGRHILAQAIAQHGLGPDAPPHQQLSQGILDHKEQRLSQLSARQHRRLARPLAVMPIGVMAPEQGAQIGLVKEVLGEVVLSVGAVGAVAACRRSSGLGKEHLAQIQTEQGLQDGAAAVHRLAEGGFLLVELVAHARVLLAHASQQEGHRAIRALLGMRWQRLREVLDGGARSLTNQEAALLEALATYL